MGIYKDAVDKFKEQDRVSYIGKGIDQALSFGVEHEAYLETVQFLQSAIEAKETKNQTQQMNYVWILGVWPLTPSSVCRRSSSC